MTITGTGFTGATAVEFGGVQAQSFVVNTPTQITVVSPAAGTAQTVDVTVMTVAGVSIASSADQFTYVDVPAPIVTAVSLTSGSTAGGTLVTISGASFTGATAVDFGGVPATSFAVYTSTQIIATSPPGVAGTADVTITTPSGTSTLSSADRFTYMDVAAPSVTGIEPTNGLIGTLLTITGTNFTGATAVVFGATAVTTNLVVNAAGTQITVAVPVGTDRIDVTVVTPGGNSPTLPADRFTYLALPAVTGINPASGPSAGGAAVTITGTSFTGATAVSFGDLPAKSFSVDSDTQITAISPAGAGTVDVTVTTSVSSSGITAADQFTYSTARTSTIGLYNPATSTFCLSNCNSTVALPPGFAYGPASVIPIVGDWNGDGVDTVGWYDPSTGGFSLADSNAAGATSTTFVFGPTNSDMLPIVGNWGQSNGADTIGLYDPAMSMFFCGIAIPRAWPIRSSSSARSTAA